MSMRASSPIRNATHAEKAADADRHSIDLAVAESAVNVQFMVKDSKKYAATGGWGFADFKDGKPGDKALHEACFPCHQPAKDHDFVFAHYAGMP
jgi:Cytochrome P460